MRVAEPCSTPPETMLVRPPLWEMPLATSKVCPAPIDSIPPTTSNLPWFVIVPAPSLKRWPLGPLTRTTFKLHVNVVESAPAPIAKSWLICMLGRSALPSPLSPTHIDPPSSRASTSRMRSALGPKVPLLVTDNVPLPVFEKLPPLGTVTDPPPEIVPASGTLRLVTVTGRSVSKRGLNPPPFRFTTGRVMAEVPSSAMEPKLLRFSTAGSSVEPAAIDRLWLIEVVPAPPTRPSELTLWLLAKLIVAPEEAM